MANRSEQLDSLAGSYDMAVHGDSAASSTFLASSAQPCWRHVVLLQQYKASTDLTHGVTGQLGMLAALLNRGCLVNGPTNDGWTALHEAAANGHGLIVDKLLASGAQVGDASLPL